MRPHLPVQGALLPSDIQPAPDERAEQAFAWWTLAGAGIAFLWVALAFALYLTGLPAPTHSISAVLEHFHLPADEFVRATGAPHGWAWLASLNYGDTLCLAGLMFTAATIALGYLALLSVFVRRRDWLYAGLVTVQLLVFLLAAVLRS